MATWLILERLAYSRTKGQRWFYQLFTKLILDCKDSIVKGTARAISKTFTRKASSQQNEQIEEVGSKTSIAEDEIGPDLGPDNSAYVFINTLLCNLLTPTVKTNKGYCKNQCQAKDGTIPKGGFISAPGEGNP